MGRSAHVRGTRVPRKMDHYCSILSVCNEDVKLFFHNARSSEIYGRFVQLALAAMDSISGLFVARGHSPWNLQVLGKLDELWQGTSGRASPPVGGSKEPSGKED